MINVDWKSRLEKESDDLKNRIKIWKFGDCEFFNSNVDKNMILSNFWPCKLEYKGLTFMGVEQMFKYYEAVELGDDECKERIMDYHGINVGLKLNKDRFINDKLKEFKEIKTAELGRDGFIWWEGKLLKDCVEQKFLQCKDYRNILYDYRGKKIVESCPWGDYVFGAVYDKESKGYVGINVSGSCAMKVMKKYGLVA